MQELVSLERWKLALALVGVLVVGLLIGFFVERGRAGGGSPTATTTPTAGPTPTPTLLPTPSASASPSPTPSPSPSPTAAPTLAPDPSVGNGSKVFSQQGSGNQTSTVPAIVSSNWGLSYSFLCSGGGQFNVTILDMSGSSVPEDPPFAVQGRQAAGVQQFVKGGQQLQVQVRVDGSCQWSYDVYSS